MPAGSILTVNMNESTSLSVDSAANKICDSEPSRVSRGFRLHNAQPRSLFTRRLPAKLQT